MKPRTLDRCSNCGVRTTQLWPLAGPNAVVVARHCANCYPHTTTISPGNGTTILAPLVRQSYGAKTDD